MIETITPLAAEDPKQLSPETLGLDTLQTQTCRRKDRAHRGRHTNEDTDAHTRTHTHTHTHTQNLDSEHSPVAKFDVYFFLWR